LYNDAGNYDVNLTVSDGVHSRQITKKNFITVNVCAGNPELINRMELSVYPNPATSVVRIIFSKPPHEGSKLYIFDLLGRKVMERIVNKGTFENGILVDVSSLDKGLYLFKLIPEPLSGTVKVVIE
jgi:PKD repeat protein